VKLRLQRRGLDARTTNPQISDETSDLRTEAGEDANSSGDWDPVSAGALCFGSYGRSLAIASAGLMPCGSSGSKARSGPRPPTVRFYFNCRHVPGCREPLPAADARVAKNGRAALWRPLIVPGR
jgi:hypothetical protein